MMREILSRVAGGETLDSGTMAAAVSAIMEGNATHAQIASFLTALKVRGETEEEIAGAAVALRERAIPFPSIDLTGALDTCGTGGDEAGTVNISTLAALVAAGAGARVAKHGNRSVSSLCGSADLLEALGIEAAVSPQTAARCLEEAGFAFLFAPLYHPAMKEVAPVRQELGFRTLFNLIGPLCNPAGVKRQLVGVYSRDLVPLMAGVLARLGTSRALVVASEDGLDEISVCAPSTVAEVFEDGRVEVRTIDPTGFGLPLREKGALKGGTPEENAALSQDLLNGAEGAIRDAVVINAAAALEVSGTASGIEEGLNMAAESLDSGAARKVLETVRRITNEDGA